MFEQYVIFGYSDYMKNALHDILKRKDVVYIDFNDSSQLQKMIMRILSTSKLSWIIQKLLLDILPKSLLNITTINFSKNTCYIFYECASYSHNKAFNMYLRRITEKSKFVHIYTNLLSSNDIYDNIESLNYIKSNSMYDMIITFNPADAKKYNITFFEQVFSKIDVSTDGEDKSDVFFCGIDKGRSELIVKIYERLSRDGLKCDFNIIGTKIENQKYPNKIKYHDELIPNTVMLKGVSNTNCILEILSDTTQPGSSLRMSEAIVYGKKLITNNKYLKFSKLYNEKQMSQFSDESDMDIEFIKNTEDKEHFLSSDSISPSKLITFLDKSLFE